MFFNLLSGESVDARLHFLEKSFAVQKEDKTFAFGFYREFIFSLGETYLSVSFIFCKILSLKYHILYEEGNALMIFKPPHLVHCI